MRVTVWRRSRLSICIWKQLKVLVIITIMVVLLAPLRNTIFYFALPGMWTEHSSLFLIKVMLDGQYFPVEETPLGPSPVKLNVNTSDLQIKFTLQQRTFLEYSERTTLLQQLSQLDNEITAELKELLKFEPQMSEHERAVGLFTLDVFMNACEAANLTYFLISGSALGAVRHHGMIPWDDDIDVIMNSSQWKKIRDVLGNVQGFELFTPKNVQWKFFMKSLPRGNRPFKWPNVDIFFFNEDDTHIWAQTWGAKASLCSKKSDVFPLKRRKFERWNLPVPRLLDTLVYAEFGNFDSACKSASYDHKKNIDLPAESKISIDCQKLHNVYPFVFRDTHTPGIIMEFCKINGRNVGKVEVPIEV